MRYPANLQFNSRIRSKAIAVVAFALAAVAPWPAALAVTSNGLQQHRKTTDPPVPAKGKLGQDLFLAIDHRNVAAVQGLIRKGADPNAKNGLEFTPLYVAAASHQPDVMKALLAAGANPNAESPYGTALSFAAISANTAGARILFEKGVDVNASRVDGITVLMLAANAGDPELVGELLKRKADVNGRNLSEASALTYAARAGNLEAGRVLLDAGAKVDNLDSDKHTPLMAAAMTGRPEFVKMLIEHGATINARDSKGRTALILATSYGDYPEVVKTLIEGGADRKLTDSKGRTAADLASSHGYSASAAILGKPVKIAEKNTRQVIEVSLKLLENSMTEFSRSTACISCHQEGLGRMVTASARNHGFKTEGSLSKAQNERIRGALNFMKPLHQQALKNSEVMKQVPLIEINEVNTGDSWLMSGMAAQNDAPTEATAAMAMVLARQQAPEGFWSFSLPRVPMQSSFFTLTALSIRAMNAYGPRASAAEISERIGRARTWLMNAPAKTCDDRSFRLLGLKWSGASMEARARSISEIVGAQQEDGGWAQAPGMHSDAYATGQALYALKAGGGMSAKDPIFANGAHFLLRTQDDDGSWFVNKRAIPANNFFDAKFPHGESQYASFNATCWATMALLETIGSK